MASSQRVHDILVLAAALSREERAQVTAELLSILEPGEAVGPGAWDDEWGDELARRRADSAPSIPLTTVRERTKEVLLAAQAKRKPR
jgi:hypothetical protein